MRACESHQCVQIGVNYSRISAFRVFLGLPLIYLPVIFLPMLLLSGALVYLHLKVMGAQDLRTLRWYLPARSSHRYTNRSQIVKRRSPALAFWTRTRMYWIFNCTWYCPVSVATLEWNAYLVKLVENFWCPFGHSHKHRYADAAIDKSFWHDAEDSGQLHPEDRNNPIWNAEHALPHPAGQPCAHCGGREPAAQRVAAAGRPELGNSG